MKLLNTVAGNTKILKSQTGTEFKIASLSLFPNDTVCPAAIIAACKDPCLVHAGRGAMSNVAAGRQGKTDFWMQDKDAFLEQLEKEIRNFEKYCNKQGKQAAFRLNTISDIAWEKHGIPQLFPNSVFYDYTKVASRLGRTPDNYKLIFSYSAAPRYQNQVKRAVSTDAPIAAVFRGFVPVGGTFLGREIIDGDKSDLVNMDSTNKILGLKLKGNKQTQKTESPFVVDPAPIQSALMLQAMDSTFSTEKPLSYLIAAE